MNLIDRLEKRALELDQRVRHNYYDQQAADDRELMFLAAKKLSLYEALSTSNIENGIRLMEEVLANDRRRDDRADDRGARRVDGPDWPVEGTVTGAD